MANAALLSIPQFFGTSYAGYTYTFYEAGGTTTPKDVYKSSNGSATVSNAHPNPLTLNANGTTDEGIWGTGYYRVILKNASGTSIFTWDNVSGGEGAATTTATATAPLDTNLNRLENANFTVWYGNTTSVASVADGTEVPANWNVLTQTGTVTAARLNPTNTNAVYGLSLTNSAGSSQRVGLIQWTNTDIGLQMVNKTIQGVHKIYCANNSTIRMALLAWTDISSPTRDVVNNWVSPTFNEGNFFITSSNLEVIATNSTAVVANTWTDLNISGTVPDTTCGLGLFIWTDGTIANGEVVSITNSGLYESDSVLEYRNLGNERTAAAINAGQMIPIDKNLVLNFGTPAASTTMNFAPVFFKAYHNTSQTISTTEGTMSFNTEVTDIGSCFASNTFTAPRAGLYCFYAQMKNGSTRDGLENEVSFTKNGTSTYLAKQLREPGGNGQTVNPCFVIVPLAANDTVVVRAKTVSSNYSTAGTSEFDTFFCGFLLHPLEGITF
jgi:hypothetical protein